jgi:hypothetical protein
MFSAVVPVVTGAGAGLVGAAVMGPGQGVVKGVGAGQVCQEMPDLGGCEWDEVVAAFGVRAAVTVR